MANTRFFLDTRNAKDGKPCVLKIAIAQKKKPAYISLDAKLIPGKQWDDEKCRIIDHLDIEKNRIFAPKNSLNYDK